MRDKSVKTKKVSRKTAVVMIVLLALALLGALAFSCLLLFGSESAPAAPEPSPTPEETPAPTPEPKKTYSGGYFLCPDGLFYPEEPLTLGEMLGAASRAAGEELSLSGDPEEVLTESRLIACLHELFPELDAEAAVSAIAARGGETVTRAEAARALNLLLDIPAAEDGAAFPDVEPSFWARDDIAAAAVSGHEWDGDNGLPAPGFHWTDGYLYYAGPDGYYLKNAWLGTLYFTSGGRYTSGSQELDGYVAAAIRENTDETMTREEKLRAMYEYVRDSFTYLKRHYYRIGDLGWPVEEAVTMYSTGKGNCYCYSSAFWAAARGLGYDAKAVSGTYGGEERAPHGWVEIVIDGRRLTYDVEIEMTIHREGNGSRSLYAMDDTARRPHGYIELAGSDNLAPRETNVGLLPR